MIEIYSKDNINFEMNGDITLTPSSCIYDSELNSTKELTLEHHFDNENGIERWRYIKEDNIISCYNFLKKKKEFYRIYEINKTLDGITAYARPLAYDLMDTVLIDTRPTDKTGQQALDIILNNTPFRGHSNIQTNSTAYYVSKNILEALTSDDENSFLNRWGGEVYFDNWDIYINDKIGSDNGVTVEFGYNLESIEENINIESVVTRGIPVGYDGIMLDGDTPWIDSDLINKYSTIKMRVVEFSDVKVKSSSEDEEGFNTIEEAREELKRLMKEAYKNGLDKPTGSYKISMVDLRETTEYENYKILETVDEGDIVHVKVKHLDIEISTRVIKISRDMITGQIISLELGDVEKNFFEKQADIQNRVDNILNTNGTVKADYLQGSINALQTTMKAQRNIAQKQEIRAMIFEDEIEGSPTYGAMCLGTMGFMIADKKTADGSDWDFRTFGTGGGFVADCITAGTLRAVTLESDDGSCTLNLKNGQVSMSKGKIGSNNTYMDLTNGKFVTKGTVLNTESEMNISKGQINNTGIINILNTAPGNAKSQFLMSHDNNGKSGIVLQADFINIIGDLIGANISTLENYMLQSEGII